MNDEIRQTYDWVGHGRQWLATLVSEVQDLATEQRLVFRSGTDDLGNFRYVVLTLPGKRSFLLLKYANPFQRGTPVWVSDDEPDLAGAWRDLSMQLGLSPADTLEVSPLAT
ncbi:MAG: hypothetical protein LBV34_10885 [Nocardiopsaceae bacterium]|nr:hypothetical protein [Nocardiopsaceae bacterium]